MCVSETAKQVRFYKVRLRLFKVHCTETFVVADDYKHWLFLSCLPQCTFKLYYFKLYFCLYAHNGKMDEVKAVEHELMRRKTPLSTRTCRHRLKL